MSYEAKSCIFIRNKAIIVNLTLKTIGSRQIMFIHNNASFSEKVYPLFLFYNHNPLIYSFIAVLGFCAYLSPNSDKITFSLE